MEEKEPFRYCKRVDIHATDFCSSLDAVVAIASEHDFRGIVVMQNRLDDLILALKKSNCKAIPICLIDYPFGAMTSDIRAASILSAKEKGAREIEIVAPYYFIKNANQVGIKADIAAVSNMANRLGIPVKYVFDHGHYAVNENVKNDICRFIDSKKIGTISTSIDFFFDAKKDNKADSIIRIRSTKQKSGCKIKTFLSTNDANEVASYVKAGVDIIGLNWKNAPSLIHAYEEMVNQEME